jgi:hypothetical protein
MTYPINILPVICIAKRGFLKLTRNIKKSKDYVRKTDFTLLM